jgi:hypothetical protein
MHIIAMMQCYVMYFLSLADRGHQKISVEAHCQAGPTASVERYRPASASK